MGPAAPAASTRVLALLGDPVAHSLSPVFQNAAIAALGLDAVYVAIRCDATAVGPLIRAFARSGGAGNVTVPHKHPAAECIQLPTPAVRRTGACNTFWQEHGELCGDNTDIEGVRHAAALLLPDLAGSRSLILGAGGAATAAACALMDAGAAGITVLNRSPDRAFALQARLDGERRVIGVAISTLQLQDASFDLVVNATSAGLRAGDALPLDLATLGSCAAALDLVYEPGGLTPFVRHARSLGIRASDGTEMLIGQGAAAFRRWFDAEPPLDVMRRALSA
jgi:shikimate dehydrogenase